MFNVVEYPKAQHYVQSPQHNPIEWQVVAFRKGQWHAQTHRFRCREYFNDIVAKKYKRVYTVYGFNASPVRHKKDGVDVLVHNIKNMDSFLDTLEIIDDQIFEQLGQRLTYTMDTDDLTKLIIKFPPRCWDNTYTISVITLAIRAGNYGVAFDSWEDIFADNNPVALHEHAWSSNTRKKAAAWGVYVPEHVNMHWWYSGVSYNSSNSKGTPHMIHNCGAATWAGWVVPAPVNPL